MRKHFFRFALVLTLGIGAFSLASAQNGNGGGPGTGGISSYNFPCEICLVNPNFPVISFTTSGTFNCSDLHLTVVSVSGAHVVAQDACGNTYNLNAAGNTAGLAAGLIFSITKITPNGNVIAIDVIAN